MKKTIIITVCAVILIVLFGICTYYAMADLGLFDGSYELSTTAKVSSYIGAGFTAVKLWDVWNKLMWLVGKVLFWGIILFIVAGIGVILGF